MKNKTTAIILAFFLGGIGVHKFYLGSTGAGVLYLLFCWTGIPSLIAFVEMIMLAVMSDVEFNIKYNLYNMLAAGHQVQNVVVQMPPQQGYQQGYQQGAYSPAQPQYPAMAQAPAPPQVQAAGYPPTGPMPAAAPNRDVAEQLKDLNNLRITGAISEEEFEQQKQRILGS